MAGWLDGRNSKNLRRSKEKPDTQLENQETGLDDAAQTWPPDFLVVLFK